MKLCIPVSAPNGIDSLIDPHLPSAEFLVIFDTESRACESVSLRDQDAGSNIRINAVLCGSINRLTLRTLMDQGIGVYGTEARTVLQAIALFENGELAAAVAAGGGCGNHDHGAGSCCSGDAPASGGHGAGHQCYGGGCGGQDRGQGGGHGHEHAAGGCCGSQRETREAASSAAEAVSGVLRIAVSSQNRKTVTEHAGKCRKFWIYEVKQGQVIGKSLLELPIEQSFHATPVGQAHPLDSVNVLITAGMGDGLRQRLLQRGIQGLVSSENSPDEAVAVYLAGELNRLPADRPWVAPCAQDDGSVPTCSVPID